MFTGLVQTIGEVARLRPSESGLAIVVQVPAWKDAHPPLTLGESIAISGCCLTLARLEGVDGTDVPEIGFDVIPQTIRMTHLGSLALGSRVNLERSATPSTLLGGHIVQGHVDGVAQVRSVLREGGEWRLRIAPARNLMPYLCQKGSVAIDGVSLTVADLDDGGATFDVCLIPETLVRTTLGERVQGDAVHIEVDCLAKMLERLVAARRGT